MKKTTSLAKETNQNSKPDKDIATHSSEKAKVEISDSGEISMLLPSEDCPLFGSTDTRFQTGIIENVINAVTKNEVKGREKRQVELALAFIEGLDPKDEVEAALATQMAAVHIHAVSLSRRMHNSDFIDQLTAMEKGFTRMTRTFAAQMEALKKYRSTGEQKVTVQHVNVNEGGQAVVGDVHNTAEPRGQVSEK